MALVNVPALWVPAPETYTTSFGTKLLDAAADRVAWVFSAPKAGNIRKVGFLLNTVPAIGGSSTLLFSLQDVSVTTGMPDDIDDQSVSIPNAAIIANTMVLGGALSGDRTVTTGELVAAVVKYDTFTAGDQVNLSTIGLNNLGASYLANNLTGAYAKVANLTLPIEIEYDDGSHAFSPGLALPWAAVGSDAYNNTSTPDEVGLLFQVPMPCRLGGVWFEMALAGDLGINLYTSSGKTVLTTIDKDVTVAATTTGYMLALPTPVVLAANLPYVLAIEPTTATSITLRNFSVRAAVALDQMPGGQAWQYATAKNPATTADFTATTTKRPVMGLMFDQVSDGFGPTAIGGPIGGPIRTQGWP